MKPELRGRSFGIANVFHDAWVRDPKLKHRPRRRFQPPAPEDV